MRSYIIAIISLLKLAPLAIAQTAPATQNETAITAPAPEENLLDDKIYFFAHSMCIDCKDAFIYFETRHKELNIPITDMKFPHNLTLYKQCVKKFDIQNAELTLPLICMKNDYIMGWDNTSPQKFEQALKRFQSAQD